MMTLIKMITGIYVRVSSEEQVKHGFSIRAQIEKLTTYAKLKGWIIYDVYEDKGISGKSIEERPAIKRLISDIEKGKVNNVLVFKIDRLTRSVKNLIELIDLFQKYNCEFNSLTESIDTSSATGRMFLKIIGIFAEFERENIVERTKVGFERKVKEGYTLAARVPSYGYDKMHGEKIQVINPQEAIIVKEIFDLFVDKNLSCLEIAKTLNERGIPTKENSTWYTRTVKNVLTNCNYIGNVRYAIKDKDRNFETKGLHEPIISKELYMEAQDIISKMKKKNYTKRPLEEHYFLNFLVCEKCGGKFVTHGSYNKLQDGTTKVIGSYRCTNYIKKKCDCVSISHRKVEKAFMQYISNIENFNIKNEIKISDEKLLKVDAIASYEKQLEKLRDKEQEIVSLFVCEKFNYEEYINMKNTIQKEISNITKQLESLNAKEEEEKTKIKQEDISKSLNENWALLTPTERRQFLTKFVDKIYLRIEERTPIITSIQYYDC